MKMDAQTRKEIEKIKLRLEEMKDWEEEKLERMENFEGTQQYERIEEIIYLLDDAISNLEGVLE